LIVNAAAAAIIGRREELQILRAALEAGRHVLVEGPHGVGKSRLVQVYCRDTETRPVVVHGSAGLTVPGLVGGHDPGAVLRRGYRADSFSPGPLVTAMADGRVLHLDEANRIAPEVVTTLISAMSEGELVVPRLGRIRAERGFRVIASVNPTDSVGSEVLPAAFLDRVVRLVLGYQRRQDELSIVEQQTPGAAPEMRARALAVVRASRRHLDVRLGSSVRGAVDLVLIAAQLGRMGAVDPGLTAALLALSSKIQLRPGTTRTVEWVIRDLWTDAVLAEHRSQGSAVPGLPALPESSIQTTRDSDPGESPPDQSGQVADETTGAGPSEQGQSASASGTGGAQRGHRGRTGDESEVEHETLSAMTSFVRASTPGVARPVRRLVHADLEPADIERIAAGIVIRRTRGRLPADSRQGGRFTTVRYNFRSDDLDIDRTVSELLDSPVPTHSQLWVHDRVPRRRAVALLLDVSGSMRGERAIESATAAAAAALATENDELAVLAFGTDVEVIKHSGDRIDANELVRRVLSLRPRGLTNLAAGLDAGRQQLEQMRSPIKIAVVMTDGVQNEGSDAVASASRFRRLNVLATTTSTWRLRHCQALALAGSGRCVGYESTDELPAALSTLLDG